eukprot:6492031-Amphidinium_carterae.1
MEIAAFRHAEVHYEVTRTFQVSHQSDKFLVVNCLPFAHFLCQSAYGHQEIRPADTCQEQQHCNVTTGTLLKLVLNFVLNFVVLLFFFIISQVRTPNLMKRHLPFSHESLHSSIYVSFHMHVHDVIVAPSL